MSDAGWLTAPTYPGLWWLWVPDGEPAEPVRIIRRNSGELAVEMIGREDWFELGWLGKQTRWRPVVVPAGPR